MLDHIQEWIKHELGVNFEEISDTATTTHEIEGEIKDMESTYHNIYAALGFLKESFKSGYESMC